MAVISLAEYQEAHTGSVIRELASLDRAGRVRDMLVCWKDDDGNEHVRITGVYNQHPESFLKCAIQASWELASKT